MPGSTSIDDVEQAVNAVRQLQQQLADMVGALQLLTARVEALEVKPAGRRRRSAVTRD